MPDTVYDRPTKIAESFMRKDDTWVLSDFFCPSCGKRDMWQLADDGEDYYHECSVRCGSCGYDMCCVGKIARVSTDNWWSITSPAPQEQARCTCGPIMSQPCALHGLSGVSTPRQTEPSLSRFITTARDRAFDACANIEGLPGAWPKGLCPRCHRTPWAHAWRQIADELDAALRSTPPETQE